MFNLAIVRTGPNAQEAVALYRHLLALAPDDANGHLNLGFLLLSVGQTTEGNAELDRAISLDPKLASRRPPQTPAGATTTTLPTTTTRR